MSDVSNRDLLNVLLSIREDLGTVKANGSHIANQFKDHVAEVKAAAELTAAKIEKLQLGAARQKGVLAALTGVGSLLGAGAGYAIDFFTKSHH